MPFKVGDKVRFLNEVGEGEVIKIDLPQIWVVDENGFETVYHRNQLVTKKSHSIDVAVAKDENPELKGKKPMLIEGMPFIDLHIEELVDENTANWTNHEILTYQLRAFRRFLEHNEAKKIARFLVIHGVGEGVLKREIITLVRGIPGCTIYDADYQKNGFGASIIERKYNWKG